MSQTRHSHYVIVFLSLIALLLVSQQSNADIGVGDHPEFEEITTVTNMAYELFSTPVEEVDISRFSEVLIDTPDFQLTTEQQDYIGQILGSEAVTGAGYLTAIQAKHTHLQHGARLLKAAEEKAAVEGRVITPEEVEAIRLQNYGAYPPSQENPEHIGRKPKLQFMSLEVNGDRAVIAYDSGPALQEATLLRIDNQWFIASNIVLQVHY